jgi:hypothetical protein
MRGLFAVPLMVLFALGACFSPQPPSGSPCIDDTRCPEGQRCVAGICGGGGSGGQDDAAVDDGSLVDADIGIDAPAVECTVPENCPNTNTCVTMACINNECVPTTKANGAQCGATEAERCCSGTCVNISNDEKNCGGCGETCAAGRTCETVSNTNTCGIKPAATTGRCTCQGANAECPDGQLCRTVSPYQNRCTPEAVGNCAPGEMFVSVNSCPNFCRYP